jgi:hypothetical protein
MYFSVLTTLKTKVGLSLPLFCFYMIRIIFDSEKLLLNPSSELRRNKIRKRVLKIIQLITGFSCLMKSLKSMFFLLIINHSNVEPVSIEDNMIG